MKFSMGLNLRKNLVAVFFQAVLPTGLVDLFRTTSFSNDVASPRFPLIG